MEVSALPRTLLTASAVEAFFLLVMLGYGPLYLHVAWHADDFVASLAAAGPSLATFFGSTFWGHRVRAGGVRRVASIGLLGYVALGLWVFFDPGAIFYIVGVTAATLVSSALAPVTLTYLTHEGGDMGRRLAARMKWQSSGWMTGGLLGGWLVSVSHRAFPTMMLVLAAFMATEAILAIKAAPVALRFSSDQTGPIQRSHWMTVLLVVPFFLAYAGNEGFFINFSLYLHAVHVTPAWVGWSSSISTGLGWALAGSIGRWTDRIGGKTLLLGVLVGYVVMYLTMSLASSQMVVIVAFSLPLYPFLNIGIQRAVAESLPGHEHGGAMGIINGATGLATFGGGALMGGVDSLFGSQFIPWTAVGLVTAGLLAATGLYRRNPGPVAAD
ncbi:MFS transporter [Sulfobacillus harzensis]|uniref:MFS transporter n=1 Tax=Sulfobacillus harzensis TaxID=2729629 RepID=A0A7Y0L4Q8_9FIRM|nr:MFS transporter [Sulfobacillus harzensis]NMP23053.1 MFS transporter [Sulfobacillus harzensis]